MAPPTFIFNFFLFSFYEKATASKSRACRLGATVPDPAADESDRTTNELENKPAEQIAGLRNELDNAH
jgi:hypothetical protein